MRRTNRTSRSVTRAVTLRSVNKGTMFGRKQFGEECPENRDDNIAVLWIN